MFYLSDKFINQIVAKNLQFLSLWLSFFKMHKTLTNLYSHILALIFITLVKETCKKCKWFSKLTLLLIVSPQNYIEEIFFGLNNIEKIICILNELFIRYALFFFIIIPVTKMFENIWFLHDLCLNLFNNLAVRHNMASFPLVVYGTIHQN